MKQMNLEKYKTLAERYTNAIWQVAQEENAFEKYEEEINLTADLLSENTEIANFFLNPTISETDKKEVLQKTFEGKISDNIYNLLNMLIDKNRMFLLMSIKSLYQKKLLEKDNILSVDVETVISLDKNMEELLKTKLEKITGKNVSIKNKINKSIIGGVVLKFNGKIIDGSVQTQLKRLQKQLI